MVFLGEPNAANIAFLLAGALVAMITQLVVESDKRLERERDLACSLYEELSNRVGRCVFDFEKPWDQWVDAKQINDRTVELLRFRKFMPVAPTIYPATAGEIALLKGRAPQAVIRFYVRLEIYRSDMELVTRYCERDQLGFVLPKHVAMVAERLRRTLEPGLFALRELSRYVPNHEQIDAEVMRDLDTLFKHERSHLPMKQRLAHYAESPPPAAKG